MGCGVGWLQIRLLEHGDADTGLSPGDDDLVAGDGHLGKAGGAAWRDFGDAETFAEVAATAVAPDADFGFAVGGFFEPDDNVAGGIEDGDAGSAEGVPVVDAGRGAEGGAAIEGFDDLDPGVFVGSG